MKPTDYLGREIKVGLTLVYPVRRGSAMWLQRMDVLQIIPYVRNGVEAFKLNGFNNLGRKVTVTNTQNTVIVEKPCPSTT